MTDTLTNVREVEVAKQVLAVQRMYTTAFIYKGGQWHRGIEPVMQECERAFADKHFDRAEHLTKVVARMIERDLPKFEADPKKWVEREKAILRAWDRDDEADVEASQDD